VIALLAILIAAAPARLFAQGGPDGGVPDDPSTAKTIKATDALVPDAPDQDVPADPNYTQPEEPYAPDLPETVGNYEGPLGVTGIFNGNVTTGCSYDPLSHSAHRAIDDIVVPGSIGKYPLKMTRYYNSRQQYYAFTAIGLSPGWAHEYSWLLWSAGHKVVSPHGNVYDDYCGPPVGVSERWENRTDAYNGTWRLADGGKVIFVNGRVTYIDDPYGLRTTIYYDANGRRWQVMEPGGRYLQFFYNATDPDGTVLLTRVEAHGLGNTTVTDWVNYSYTLISAGVEGRNKKMLTGVAYSDGTSATYEYRGDNVTESQTTHKMYPLLQRCDDVRYNSPMRTIRYEYQNGGPHGVIINEKNPGVGAVSAIAPGVPTGGRGTVDSFTETRGDGPTRTFNYTHIAHCQGTECGPCDDYGTNGPNQQMLLNYTDFQGHTTTLGYDTNWYVNSVRDANTHTTSYTRGPGPPNGIGQITRITHPSDNTYIEYTYESDPHYIHSIRDERGEVTTYTRDGNHRVTRIDYPSDQWTPVSYETFDYNNFGQVTRHRVKNGAYVHFQYDTRGLLIYKWNPTWNATAQPGDPKTTYTYHTWWGWADRILTETLPANVSNQVASETYEYDRNASGGGCPGRGLVTKITHADGNWRSFGYSQFGNKMWEENELRQRTSYTYDNYNRVLTVTNPLNQTETFSYLKPGTSSSYLHTTNSVYTHTSRTGIVTSNIYDQNFRKTSVTQASGTSLAATTTFGYDAVGNLTQVTDPLSRVTLNGYDARNRKTATTEAYGTNVQRTTVWHYDGASNIFQIDRPDSTSETKGYDALNRVVWDTVPQTSTINLTTWFGYNPSGTIQWVKDANLRVTTFEYDAADQKTKMTYPGTTQSQSWVYDAAHNLASRITVGGKVQHFGYDNRNRKVAVTWGANANVPEWLYFGYDAASRLTTAENGVGAWGQGIISIVTRSYDAAGRLLWEAQNVAGLGVKFIEHAYDSDGKETRLLVRSENYDYTFSYDAMGRFEKIFASWRTNPVWQYTYDPASNETARLNLYDGVAQTYTRDALNRMASRYLRKGTDPAFSAEVYTYDSMSRLLSVAREDGKTDSFTYYLDGELNTAHYGTTRNVDYALDKAGNRTSVTDNVNGNATYTPNALNQYTAVTGSTISNGNEHEVSSYKGATDAQQVNYGYINDERLNSVTSVANTYNLAYDALGRCVKRTLNGVTTYYIYDGEKPILEYNSTGGLAGWNVYGKGIDEILQRIAYGNYFFQQDREGSVTHLTDPSGNVIEKYRYDAFGAPTFYNGSGTQISSTAYNNRFLFTGREYAATYYSTYVPTFKFYEYRARAYHPALGRFMSEDPKLFDAGDYNLFRYCHNDPIDFTDPMGLEVGFGESLIPVWGSGHMAYDAFNEGHYGMAAFHAAMAITDVTGAKAVLSVAGKAALKGAAKVAAERAVAKAAEKTVAEKEGGLVIGKLKDLRSAEGWRKGDHTLNLPDRGSVKENWKQNSSLLRQEERTGKPIRDMSTDANGNLRDNTGFLKAERNALENGGRTFDTNSRSWTKPPDSTAVEQRAIQQGAEKAARDVSNAEHGLNPKPQ
jgi:RHS repeat-associated protein